MDEQVKSRLQAVIRGLSTLAETIEVVSEKVVNFIDEFAVNVEQEIDRAEGVSRAEAMERHPAGKGRVETTREDKLEYIRIWLKNQTGYKYSDLWFNGSEQISDRIVNFVYDNIRTLL